MLGGIKSVRVLVPVVFAALARQGATQNPEANPEGNAPTPSISVSRPPDSRFCPGIVPSASRTREGCEPKTVVVEVDKQVAVTLKVPSPNGVYCAATYEVEYAQRDKTVRVEGTITNSNCAASNGEYKLAVSVRDEHGEVKTLDFFESWQRKDDQPVKFKGDYSVGENVDVVHVRPVQLRCTCTDVPTE
jgi:hypothetical protein